MFAADAERFPNVTRPDRQAIRSFWSRLTRDTAVTIAWLRRVRCGLGGHFMVNHYEPRRLSLECIACGKQTAGWTLR